MSAPLADGSDAPTAVRAPAAPGRALPSVTVVLVNYNGREHLAPCLESIAALDYPAELVSTLLVDNASSDGSVELLAQRYPWVRVLPQTSNLGFSPAVNLAAERATSECVALLNNDSRVDPGWLRAAADRYDPARGVVCVAGAILDWDGTHVDFVEGTINLHGFGQQQQFGTPVAQARITDGAELPFACGGAMLVQRSVFNDLGGFDPRFFAYFEDVDFGWRLQVCGYRVVLAAGARSYHRHHGTSSRFRMHERMLLLERNSLRALIKNTGDEHLPRLLAAALLLQAKRAQHDARSDRDGFDMGAGRDEMEEVHRLATARLHATNDVLDDLDGLMALRARIQSRRQVPDAVVLSRFGKPLEPLGNDTAPYAASLDRVIRLLGLRDVFPDHRAGKIVVLASGDVIGARMAGTAIRAWELARSLGRHVHTVLASPKPVGRRDPLVDVVEFADPVELHDLVRGADAVLVFGFDLRRYPFLARTPALVIVDLYDPWIFGSLEQYDQMTAVEAEGSKSHEVYTLNELLDVGDFFICASERQRDFWLGMLASRGRLDKPSHDLDPHLRTLIDVVPFGCPDDDVVPAAAPVLKGGRFDAIGAADRVILWGGGTWDWFDPLGTLEAFLRISATDPSVKLFFMGLELEGRGFDEMPTTKRLRARVRELGVEGKSVVFGPWVPYDERGAFLAEADIGVVAAKAMAESRLAWRTRMLDHFWAGLPTITTAGDVLSDLVHDAEAGIRIPANDVGALEAALRALLYDDARRARCAANARLLADRYRWADVTAPVVRLAADPGPWRAVRAARGRGGDGVSMSAAHAADVERLSAELADTKKHLAAARRKLDVLNKTPIYPLYKKLQSVRSRAGRG